MSRQWKYNEEAGVFESSLGDLRSLNEFTRRMDGFEKIVDSVMENDVNRSTIRDFIIWLQEEKDLKICKQEQEIVEVGYWDYEWLYRPVTSIEDLLDEYLKEK